jgi:hypothetical protein
VSDLCRALEVEYVFKASFDNANRNSWKSSAALARRSGRSRPSDHRRGGVSNEA